jgi:hypothetical protein
MADRLCSFAWITRRTLTCPSFLLERKIQAFRKTAEGQRRAAKGGVLLGQPGQFLATVRTVICHKERPLRSSRGFESDHIHTGHNARSCRIVRRFGFSRTRSRGHQVTVNRGLQRFRAGSTTRVVPSLDAGNSEGFEASIV